MNFTFKDSRHNLLWDWLCSKYVFSISVAQWVEFLFTNLQVSSSTAARSFLFMNKITVLKVDSLQNHSVFSVILLSNVCLTSISLRNIKKRNCIMNFHYRYSLELILPGRLFLHYRLSLVLGGKTNTCFFFLYNYRKVYHDTHNALLLYASLYMREEKRKIAIWSIFSKSITV